MPGRAPPPWPCSCLAREKGRVGRATGRAVLFHEARVTYVDGLLAVAILAGLSLNALAGWWWADPASAFVIVGYGLREAVAIRGELHRGAGAAAPED